MLGCFLFNSATTATIRRRCMLAITIAIFASHAHPSWAQRTQRKDKPETTAAIKPATIDLFDGMKSGQLAAKLIQKDEKQGQLLLLNQGRQPINVEFPEAFVGFHVINPQVRVPNNPRLGEVPNRAQSTGASISDGFLRSEPITEIPVAQPTSRSKRKRTPKVEKKSEVAQKPADEASIVPPKPIEKKKPVAGYFFLPPGKTGRLPVTSVCLEYGRPTPNSGMTYQILSVEQFAGQKPVLRELIPLFVRSRIDQRTAQAAAWHVSNGLSWSQLTRLKPVGPSGLPSRSLFKNRELAAAKALVEKAGLLAQQRQKAPTSSSKQPTRTPRK